MSTEKQIAANRRNSLRSTGPRTPIGRAKASQNAMKYGLSAKTLVIFDECEDDFEAFVAEIFAARNPVGAEEEELARNIAMGYWRFRRALRAEAALFNSAGCHDVGVFHCNVLEMANFNRHKSATFREIQSMSSQLERMQARRRGEIVSPPIEVVVSGTIEEVVKPSTSRQPEADTRQSSLEFLPSAGNRD